MPNLALLGHIAGQPGPMGVVATVARAPVSADDTLDAEWTIAGDVGDEADTETCRWVGGPALPAVGDEALILIDDQGDAWAIVRGASEPASRVIGTSTLTWPGGSNFSNTLTVTHGCPFTPLIVIPRCMVDPGAGNEIRVHAHTATDTTFKLFAKYDPAVPGAGFTVDVAWEAAA